MEQRILVIGANRGIGLEVTRRLAQRGAEVQAVCRKSSPELQALVADHDLRVHTETDITDAGSLDALNDRLGATPIDWLMVVAGIMARVELDALDTDAIRRQFEVNTLGPLQAVATLRRHLRSGSKIGLVTSRMGSIGDNSSGGSYGYRMSKAALNMAGRSLAHDLKADQIAVALLHPGWVRTAMTGQTGNIGAAEAARGLIERMDALSLETTGTFFHQDGQELPW